MVFEKTFEFSILDHVKIKDYPEAEDIVAGVRTKLASMSRQEVQSLAEMLDKMFYLNSYYTVKQTIVENFDLIVDLVRSVKTETKQPFEGILAKGNKLTIKPFDTGDFTNVWGTDTGKTWQKSVSAGTSYDYLGTSSANETTAEEEGIIILGLLEKEITPKIDQIQLEKNGEQYIPQYLEWDAAADEPFLPLPEPFVMLPETSYYIKVHAYESGTTELVPVGFKVLQAKSVTSLI